ncbi:MAG TPA: hypothetical protein VNK92_00620 [Vicinamibacterales bacterium]|nr:hypothetical protein [Vicinamibacterales bacterium]
MRVTVPCTVARGMFSDERFVTVQLAAGRSASAFVHKSHVLVDRDPEPSGEVPGKLFVSLVQRRAGSAIVDLPEPAIDAGQRVEVPLASVSPHR